MRAVLYDGRPAALIEESFSLAGDGASRHLAEVVFTGWQSPRLDGAELAALPRLRAVFHASGSIRDYVSDAFWARDIPICSAYAANAVPVAEFAHAAIMLSLKRVWYYAHAARRERCQPGYVHMPGAFGSTVGLVSLGAIGRRVAEKLRASDLHLVVYDPYLPPERAAELGVRLVSLEELFDTSDVVSLHTPLLPETRGMVQARLLRSMKPDATLLNTARGGLLCEPDLITVLQERPDLTAVLDLTDPTPPAPGSPLFTLPNVVLTPHIAGSMGAECGRMGLLMAEEARRFLAGEPLRWRITREAMERMA